METERRKTADEESHAASAPEAVRRPEMAVVTPPPQRPRGRRGISPLLRLHRWQCGKRERQREREGARERERRLSDVRARAVGDIDNASCVRVSIVICCLMDGMYV